MQMQFSVEYGLKSVSLGEDALDSHLQISI